MLEIIKFRPPVAAVRNTFAPELAVGYPLETVVALTSPVPLIVNESLSNPFADS